MKLFPDFTGIPFDYQIISWVANYAHNRRFLTSFNELIIDRELYAVNTVELLLA